MLLCQIYLRTVFLGLRMDWCSLTAYIPLLPIIKFQPCRVHAAIQGMKDTPQPRTENTSFQTVMINDFQQLEAVTFGTLFPSKTKSPRSHMS